MTFEYAYSNGSLIVDGTVGTAPLTFGTYKVDEQGMGVENILKPQSLIFSSHSLPGCP